MHLVIQTRILWQVIRVTLPSHGGELSQPREPVQTFYLETCSTFRTPGVIEELVDGVGADRVLFGSDMPLMDPRSQIGKIITARISDEAKQKILGGNAGRLLGI